MTKYTVVTVGILLSAVLGATVFREPIAWAQAAGTTITGPLDSGGNVRVHEQGIADVNVTNEVLPVAVVNVPQPFVIRLLRECLDSACWGRTDFVVPEGKRLVIQEVTGWTDHPGRTATATMFQLIDMDPDGSVRFEHTFGSDAVAGSQTGFSEPTTLYVEGGQRVLAGLTSHVAQWKMTISGYLVATT